MLNINKIWNSLNNTHLFRVVAMVIYIFQNVPSDYNIENIPMKLIFVWGIYLIIKDFFTDKTLFTSKFWKILLAIVTAYAVSVILNLPHQFPITAYNWVYLMHTLFLIYPFDYNENLEVTNKWAIQFNDVIIWMIGILGILSIIMYVFNVEYLVWDGTGTHTLRQGFMENRLFGLYTSPNMGSILGVLSIFASVFNNILKRGKWHSFQVFYIVNIVVQYIYFVLSRSRGTTLMIYLFFALTMMYFVYRVFITCENRWKLMSKVIVVSLLGMFTFYSVEQSSLKVLSYIPGTVESIVYNVSKGNLSTIREDSSNISEAEDDSSKLGIRQIVIQHDEEGSELSSGRFSLWEAGINATLERPLFGLADTDIYRGIEEKMETSQIDTSKLSKQNRAELRRGMGNMHNTYVQIFVKSGIVGLILFIIFGVAYVFYHLKYFLNPELQLDNEYVKLGLLLMLVIIALLGQNMVENNIIFNNRSPIGHVFWTYAGYLNYLRYQLPKKKTN